MNMGFGQARCHEPSPRIDDAGIRPGQCTHLFVAADREDTTILDCDGLRIGLRRVGRENPGIDQDQLWGGDGARGQEQHRHPGEQAGFQSCDTRSGHLPSLFG
jgi:hypothetical protein